MLYLVISWAPTLATRAGMSVRAASLAASSLQVGGIIAGLTMGRALHRFRVSFLTSVLAGACLLIGTLGLTLGSDLPFGLNLFLLGGALFAALFSLNYLSGTLYPMRIRGVGAGFGSAFGRVGSFLGPLAGSGLASSSTTAKTYVLAASPMALAAVLAAALGCSDDLII